MNIRRESYQSNNEKLSDSKKKMSNNHLIQLKNLLKRKSKRSAIIDDLKCNDISLARIKSYHRVNLSYEIKPIKNTIPTNHRIHK